MAVLQAIIDKATSPAILSGYQDVLKAVSDSVLTNMPQQDILKLVKLQLEDKVDWDISTYTPSPAPRICRTASPPASPQRTGAG